MGMFSTMGDIMSTVRGYLEYREGYHDKCGDILSIVGMFSTVRDIIFCNLSTVGDLMIHVRDIMSTVSGVQYQGTKYRPRIFQNDINN